MKSVENKYTLLKRTIALEENILNDYNGYEEWLFEVKGQIFYLVCDLYNLDFSEKKERIIIADFYHESAHGLTDHEKYVQTNNIKYSARHVLSSIVDLVVRVIEPERHFRYVSFVAKDKWKQVHNFIIKKYGQPAEPHITEKFYQAIEQDTESNISKLIDIGHFHCLVGDLFNNPIWRKNNNLPPLK